MLTIRKEQMAVLEANMARRFRKSLFGHVRQELREETRELNDEALLQRIDAAVARGRQYGLSSERDLMLFADLDFARGANFETQRDMLWARRILAHQEMEPSAKMDLIYERLAYEQNPPPPEEAES